LVAVKAENPLRATIVPSGPIDLQRMFETGARFIAEAGSTLTSVIADRSAAVASAVRSGLDPKVRQQARREQRNARSARNVRSARHEKQARASRSARKAPSSSRVKVAAHARKTARGSREGG
jgi:hypothetical protein